MRGEELRVEVQLDDGKRFGRALMREEGQLKQHAWCSWMQSAKSKECSAEIMRLFGREDREALHALFIRALMDATANERAIEFEKMLAEGRRSADEIARDVARFVLVRLSKVPETNVPAAFDVLLDMVAEAERAVLEGDAGAMLTAKIRELGVPGAIVWANERKRAADVDASHKVEARKELEARVRALPSARPDEIKALEELRDRLARELGAARERIMESARRRDVDRRARGELGQAELLHAAADKERRAWLGMRDRAAERKELQERLVAIEAELDNGQAPPPPDRAKVREIIDRAEAIDNEAAAIVDEQVPMLSEHEAELGRRRAVLEEVRNSPWTRLLKMHDEISSLVRPKTKAIAAALEKLLNEMRDTLRTYAKGGLDAVPALEENILHAERAVDAVRQEVATALEGNAAAKKRREDLKAKARVLYQEAAAEEDRREKVHRAADLEFAQRRRALAQERSSKRFLLGEIERADGATGTALERAAANLDAKKAVVLQLQSVAVDEPEGVSEIEQRLADVKTKLTSLAGASAARVELERLSRELRRAESEGNVYGAMEWALHQVRAAQISESSGPLLATLETYLTAAGRGETPYVRAGRGVCEIGWRTPAGLDVPIQALSGGEWALFAAGLAASVIILREAPLRVLVVEAGETDGRTLQQLCDGIRGISDGLTCAIVMTPREATVDGWTTIALGQEVAA